MLPAAKDLQIRVKFIAGYNVGELVAMIPRLGKTKKRSRSISDTEFVAGLYRGLLKREPDPHGMAHFVRRLHSGYSPEEILIEFSESIEFRARYPDKAS